MEQIADSEQTTTLSCVLKVILERMEGQREQNLDMMIEKVWKEMEQTGLRTLVSGSYISSSMAMVRKQEIYACLNRYRGFEK